MLTTSDQDGEALSAIRKANNILARWNLNWEEFLTRTLKVVHEKPKEESKRAAPDEERVDPGPGRARVDDEEATRVFNWLLANVSTGFRKFVENIHEQWETEGWMTKRQWEPLKRAYERGKGVWEDV